MLNHVFTTVVDILKYKKISSLRDFIESIKKNLLISVKGELCFKPRKEKNRDGEKGD